MANVTVISLLGMVGGEPFQCFRRNSFPKVSEYPVRKKAFLRVSLDWANFSLEYI